AHEGDGDHERVEVGDVEAGELLGDVGRLLGPRSPTAPLLRPDWDGPPAVGQGGEETAPGLEVVRPGAQEGEASVLGAGSQQGAEGGPHLGAQGLLVHIGEATFGSMLLDSLQVDVAAFETRSGWDVKPEGL